MKTTPAATAIGPCALLLLAAARVACAGDAYRAAADAYKSEMKRDEPALINPGFAGDVAGSQAKRRAAGSDAAGDAAAPSGNGLRFASPTIYGTVRGDVTIVVQRGAVRGGITSIRR